MLDAPVPIFEDEDEDELKSRFVEMSVAFPNHMPIAITHEIFKNLRDPEMRANQAAIQWSRSLEILERIRQAKLNGGKEPKTLTKVELQNKILACVEDESISYSEKKARIDGYMSIAKLNGWEMRPADTGDDDKGRGHFPKIEYHIHPTQQAAAA